MQKNWIVFKFLIYFPTRPPLQIIPFIQFLSVKTINNSEIYVCLMLICEADHKCLQQQSPAAFFAPQLLFLAQTSAEDDT